MMTLFYWKFILTSILFSLVIGGLLLHWDKNNRYSRFELLLYSLGLGPVLTVLFLYYLLLIFPWHTHSFYVWIILMLYLVMLIFALRGLVKLGGPMASFFKDKRKLFLVLPLKTKLKRMLYPLTIMILLGTFVVNYVNKTLPTPIEGHDALVYGNFGKLYAQKREIRYVKLMYPASSGFVFIGSQKPAFSLLLTWEMMLNDAQTNENENYEYDLYFRSISGYYGLLIVGITFFWLQRKNKLLALLGLLVLFSGLRFFLMVMDYHLDSYRIFFLTLSWVWLGYTIKNRDRLSFILLGIFSGFAGFIHLIGLLAAGFNLISFFIFSEEPLKTRAWKTAFLILIILACGNFQYILEFLFGSLSGYLTYI